MKKSIVFLCILLCVTPSFAAKVPLPQWFTDIPENEYVGISESSVGAENQAITMALLQYMFANHAQGYGYNQNNIMSSSWNDGVQHEESHQNVLSQWWLTDTISYDILETKKLSSGEVICRITAGSSNQTEITIQYQEIEQGYQETNGDVINNEDEKHIEVVIRSNQGDWVLSFYRKFENEEENHKWVSVFKSPEFRSVVIDPINSGTQYIEGKKKPMGEKVPCLDLKSYSICANLLAGYRHILVETNPSLAFKSIAHCYDGEIPIYSDAEKYSQEIPIVLRTPINGISLNEEILDSKFPMLFYDKDKNLSYEDSTFIKSFIDAKIEQYKLPPFSEYAKKYIEPRVNQWQTKGEFEKTAIWQERVSEPNRKKKIKEFLEEAKEQYLPQYAHRQQHEFTLGTYDPDHEVYLVKENTLGDLLIPVSIQDAPFFKQNWEKRNVVPHYDIMGKEAGVSSIDFKLPNNMTFTYKADTALVYSSEEIQYNFSPLDIPLIGQSPMQNLSTNLFNQSINKIVITTPFDLTPMSSVLVSYKNIFGKYEMPDKDETFPYVVMRVTLTGNPQLVRIAKQSLALDLGQSYITEQTVPMEDKILFLVPIGVKSIYLTDGNGQRQLIYSGRLIPNTIYDGVIKVQ